MLPLQIDDDAVRFPLAVDKRVSGAPHDLVFLPPRPDMKYEYVQILIVSQRTWKRAAIVELHWIEEPNNLSDTEVMNKARSFIQGRIENEPSIRELFVDNSVFLPLPVEIEDSLKRFKKEHPPSNKYAFIMMDFKDSEPYPTLSKAIRRTAKNFGLEALRADDRQYHNDLYYSVLTYIHGCDIGIAVFDRIQNDAFNPNVALEVGYMLALGKPVCLLKDKSLIALPTDLVGKLYVNFDPFNVNSSVDKALTKWLFDHDFILSDPSKRTLEVVELHLQVRDLARMQEGLVPDLKWIEDPPRNYKIKDIFHLQLDDIICTLYLNLYFEDEGIKGSPYEQTFREAVLKHFRRRVNQDDKLREKVTGGKYFKSIRS